MNTKIFTTIETLKVWAKLSLLLVVPLFLTGCFGNTSNTSSQSTFNENLITVWRQKPGTKAEKAASDALISSFRKENPSVTVEYKEIDPAQENYESAVLNALASGNGPMVWEIRNDELPRHKDKLQPLEINKQLTDSYKKNFAATIADEMINDNKLYGLPMAIDPLVLYVNNQHLKDANVKGLPETWEEVIMLTERLTTKVNNQIVRPGIALGTTRNIDRASDIIQLLMLQAGTQMTDSSGKTATFDLYEQKDNQPTYRYPGKAAINFYSSFADPRASYFSWDANQAYTTQAFINGQLSMMINYLSLAPQITALNEKLGFTYTLVPQLKVKQVPVGDSPAFISDPIYTAKYRSLVVSKPPANLTTTQKKRYNDLGWFFIRYAVSPEVSASYSSAVGLIPPQNSSSIGGNATRLAAFINPYLKTWYKGPSPRTVDDYFAAMLYTITEEKQPVDKIVTEAAAAVTTILK